MLTRFYRPAAKRQPLRFPLPSPRHIAVLCDDFSLPPTAREFSADDIPAATDWKPDALVAPLNTALLLAARKISGELDLPSLDTAIAVVTRLDDAPLADHHRDLLWRAFEVPVFEILLDTNGTVIARECEVHDGLHLEGPYEGAFEAGGYSAEIVSGHCDCDSSAVTSRLRLLQHVEVERCAGHATGCNDNG